MSALKNIVMVGATGTLGAPIFAALSGARFHVTVVAREGSTTKSDLPPGTRVITADYASRASLVTAFKGADAIVSAIASMAIASQPAMIDAAIEAGVRRFIPSEFGSDTAHEKTQKLPVYRGKVATINYLREKAREGKIEWTAIVGGPFLDWGLKTGFLGFNYAEKKATIFDGGKTTISMTTLADLGRAVVGVLEHPEETRDKVIYVQSARTSQLQLLEMIEKASNATYERVEVNTADLEQAAMEKFNKGDMSGIRNFLMRAIFAQGYGGDFHEKEANALVGVRQMDSQALSELVAEVVEQSAPTK